MKKREIPKTVVSGIVAALLLCGCIQQKAPEIEIPPAVEKVPEETAEEVPMECIAEFHGTLTVNQKSEPIDLYYYRGSENKYWYALNVAGRSKTFPMHDDVMPASLGGFEIYDVNQDGMDDILIGLGIYGKSRPMDCFLSTEASEFILMEDFSELFCPAWRPDSCTIVDSGGSGDAYWMRRYKISGTELVLLETLDWIYVNGGAPRYTQKKLVNGELVTVLDSVPESQVDLDRWYR